MKFSFIIFSILLVGSLVFVFGCKAKKEINDPTQLEIHVLAELNKGVPANQIQKDLSQFAISDIKPTNKTLNQYLYKVTLRGQSADELLRAFNNKDYIKSAVIAPTGDGPAENMPNGKSTKTKPIKG